MFRASLYFPQTPYSKSFFIPKFEDILMITYFELKHQNKNRHTMRVHVSDDNYIEVWLHLVYKIALTHFKSLAISQNIS